MTYVKNKLAALAVATGLLLGIPATAGADNVTNTLTSGGPSARTITAGGAGVTATYGLHATGGSCNADASNPVTVNITAPNSTATPGSFQFTACGTEGQQEVTFTSSTPGSHAISHATTGGKLAGNGFNNNANFTLIVTDSVPQPPPDTTPPLITYTLSPESPNGDNGWYTTNVALTWTVTENESPTSLVETGCVDQDITADQAATVYSCSATSDGGSAVPVEVTVKRDATAPDVSVTGVSNTAYALGTVPSVGCSTTDATSGVAQYATLSGAGTSVGSHTATCSGAVDNAGNDQVGAAQVTYTVHHTSTDLLAPITTSPGRKSAFKANANIPVKVQLTGDSAGVTGADLRIKVTRVGSDSGEDITLSSETATNAHSGNQLRYSDGQYIFNLSAKSIGGVGSYLIEVTSAGVTIAEAPVTVVK